MEVDNFITQVQRRAGLASRTDAERAARATLEALAERERGGVASSIAALLCPEIRCRLRALDPLDGEALNDFFECVRRREGVEMAQAVRHARAVIEVLGEAVIKRVQAREHPDPLPARPRCRPFRMPRKGGPAAWRN